MRRFALFCSSLAITLVSFAACASTPGRAIEITFRAVGEGDPSFTTSTGWSVSVRAARLVVGPIYVQAPQMNVLLGPFAMSVARAHGGADEYEGLATRAEWLDQRVLDLLAPAPTELGVGHGIAGTIGEVEVDLEPPSPDLAEATHGHHAWIAGSATRGTTTIAFEGGLDVADITIARRVQGIPVAGAIDDGSTLVVTAHLHDWLDRIQFDRLDASGVIAPGTQPYDAWTLGARTASAFDATVTP